MMRLRLVVLLAGAGALLAGVPSPATAGPGTAGSGTAGPGAAGPGTPAGPAAGDPHALALLTAAARAARERTYSGTQYVSTWRGAAATSAVLDVSHSPGVGSVVWPASPQAAGQPTLAVGDGQVDGRLLRLLADSYSLVVAGSGSCSGRPASIVEARRPDGAVAGRFWLDGASSLVLRREVYDSDGARVRSSAFVDLSLAPADGPVVVPAGAAPTGSAARPADLGALGRAGWSAPPSLPAGMVLFEARQRDVAGAPVLQLAYSDGLSTLSLFAQPGSLGTRSLAGYGRAQVGATAVWVQPGAAERVVWDGGGRVWTLVSDAPSETVRAVVGALPGDRAPSTGVPARLGRGLVRLASLLNPFR